MNSDPEGATPRRSRQRENETFILLAGCAALLIVLIWGAALHLISIERHAAERASIESSRELVDTYEAQMVRSLAAIDQTLKIIKYTYEFHGEKHALTELLGQGLLPSTLVFGIGIADHEGNIIQSAGAQMKGSIAAQSYFAIHGERDTGLPFVGRTVHGAGADQRSLYFSRRLNAPDGMFSGIVFVAVDPAYFSSGYERSRLGEQGVLGLLGTDGVFRVRRSGDNVTAGDAIDIAGIIERADASQGQSVLMESPWDGVQRYLNARRLRNFPLIAIAGLSASEQMAEFERRRRAYLWEAAVASIMLLAISLILSRALWQMARNRRRLRKVQETFYAASEASLDGFFLLRSIRGENNDIIDFVFDDMNSRAERLVGASRQEVLGKSLCEIFPACRKNGVFQELAAVAVTGAVHEKEWKNRQSGIHAEWLHREVVCVEDGVVAIVRDITERKRAELLRVEQGRVLEMIASSMPLHDVLASLVQLVESQAPHTIAAVRLLDDDGTHLRYVAAPNLPRAYIEEVDPMRVGPGGGSCVAAIERSMPVVSPDIRSDPLWGAMCVSAALHGLRACWSTPILSHQGKVLGTLALYAREAGEPGSADMQLLGMAGRLAGIAIERRRSEERIHHMAHHDALTGLPNRVLLEDRLRQAMLQAQRDARAVLVALIDLDNFKLINDSLGHNVGDELLQAVARRMTDCVRRTDTVARLGGDEFVIVIHDQERDTESAMSMLQKVGDRISQPAQAGVHSIQVTCSIGVAMYPDDGEDLNTLLRNADAAMYRAKELGHNRCEFYTREMNIRIHEKRELQEGLRNAILRQEFVLLYQPQVDLQSGSVLGVEALIRWQHPGMGLVSPAKFIGLAEETGLIVPIGDWAIHVACRQNRMWQRAGLPHMRMSVNVSARQFRESNLVERVAHALHESGLEPHYLELELTESLIMQDVQRAVTTMRELQAMGVHLSIDDFGTGYSSLSALKSFPISRLKLDRSFVHALPDDADDKVIATAVITLGHRLGLRVIAEGVETREQLAFLRTNGCDEMQGYYFSKPVAADELEKLLAMRFPLQIRSAAL
jgi:diguanylate cyclase (GGDEF)-like protein/PAS domain S-box-containing protein